MSRDTAEFVYLWNWYGTRRHISTGRAHGAGAWTLCGQPHQTREMSERRHGAAKLDKAPLCVKCGKKAGLEPDAPRVMEATVCGFSVIQPDCRVKEWVGKHTIEFVVDDARGLPLNAKVALRIEGLSNGSDREQP